MNTLDRQIASLVRSLEKAHPPEETETWRQGGSEETRPHRPPVHVRRWLPALAASGAVLVLLASLMVPTHRRPREAAGQRPPDSVLVRSVESQGKPAEAFIFADEDPDLTIIWVERRKDVDT